MYAQRKDEAVHLRIAGEPARVISMREATNPSQEFMDMYQHFYPQMKDFVRILGGMGRSDSDDIVQDIFLRIWENFQRIMEVENLESYLFIMVRNRLINERRDKETRRRINRN